MTLWHENGCFFSCLSNLLTKLSSNSIINTPELQKITYIWNGFVMKRYLQILGLVFVFFSTLSAFSTHMVGGFISYQYDGEGSTGVRYIITINSYRDCKATSIDFPKTIEVCVYNKNDQKLAGTYTFNISSREKVNPVGRTDCPEATQVCLEHAVYRKSIVVPKSSFGYFVKWEICCRNEQVNLRNDVDGNPFIGQTYQTIIPPSNVVNSSPYFKDVPVPFMCINDTVQVSNYAVDADGDVLVYKLATPWYGASLSNNYPGCAPFYDPPKPIADADYSSGYNGQFPFGPTGLSLINSASGVTTFKATKVGNYAVAIDVEEYRNGVMLSSTRLDLQVLIINCTPNNKPTISTPKKIHTVFEGDQLCFDVTSKDKDNHNITLTGSGDLISGINGFTGNRATFAPAFAKGTVTSQFCWKTDCSQGRKNYLYFFTAKAVDDGCPSKFTLTDVAIRVLPFTGKSQVTGPSSVCQGSKGIVYNVTTTADTLPELTGHTLDVKITNGTLVSFTPTSIIVNWDKTALSGKIQVIPVSRFGCTGDTTIYNVNLIQSPPAPVIPSIDTVCENTSKTYSATVLGGMTYQWWVNNGSVLGSSNNSSINIVWGQAGKASAKVIQINSNNCPGDTAYLNVWVSKPQTPPISGKASVCPNSSNIEYKVDFSEPGSSFFWTVSGGTVTGSSNGSSVKVNWGNQGTGFVKVIEINRFGCKGDTMFMAVNKTYNLISDKIQGDTDICENSMNQVFSVPFSPATTYSWTVSGGVLTSGQGTNSIRIDWGSSGTGSVSMYETSYDSVNQKFCVSTLVSRVVNIRPYPTANTINGVSEICQSGASGTYSVNGMVKSTYLWSVNNDTSGIKGQGTSAISLSYSKEGTFTIRAVETSEFGCSGPLISFTLIVHPRPRTTPIIGDSVICSPNLSNYNYSVTGFPGSRFDWLINGGAPVSASTGNLISINWSGQQNSSIKVVETSDFGCVGDTIRLNIFYDNPALYLSYITVNPPPADDNGMEVYWKLVNAPRYNNQLIIQRRRAGSGELFADAGTVNGSVVKFNHVNTNNDINAWDYRVKGYDLCGKEIYTDVHTNILLSGTKTDAYSVSMNFTPYLGWGSASIRYDLYRQLKNSTDFELYEANITDFNAAFSNGLEYYTQCYRVKATRIGTDTVSWSNDICFNFEPTLFIPTAFSPNADDLNDGYSVRGGALKTFDFMIYNRWGEKLYQTDDLKFVWDGRYKGQDQPQDVYMYYCYYTGFDGKKYSTKGTITLLR